MNENDEVVIKNDDELGDFVLNKLKMFVSFKGKINWLGKECEVYLSCTDDVNNFDICIGFLKQIYGNLEEFNSKLIDFIVLKLLDLANEWNDNTVISKEQLVKSLEINYCSVSKNGRYDVSYSCGDIFLGHNITVRGNIVTGEIKEALIEG